MPLPIERVGDVLSHFPHADQEGKPEFGAWIDTIERHQTHLWTECRVET